MADLSPCVLCLQLVGGRERRWHQHRAPVSAPAQGAPGITCSFLVPVHTPLPLFLGPWGGGFVQHVSTPPLLGLVRKRRPEPTVGGLRHGGEVLVSKAGSGLLEALIQAPPPSRQPPHPAPKGCTVCPGAGRMENAPPPRACHHACAWSALSLSSQDVLPAGTRGTPSRQGAAWRRSQGQGTSCHCRSAG